MAGWKNLTLLHGLHSHGSWNLSILNAIILTSKKGHSTVHLMLANQDPQKNPDMTCSCKVLGRARN